MDSKETALVLTDPQNDFLSEAGTARSGSRGAQVALPRVP